MEKSSDYYYTKEGEEAALEKFSRRVETEPILDFSKHLYAQYPDARVALVGGIVRDGVLGCPDKDYDVIVEGIGQNELIEALKPLGKVNYIKSRAYGVIKFTPEEEQEIIELALPRREEYETGKRAKHATVETEGFTIEDDFSRRDFTFNAMGYELRSKTLIDPFGGLSDIRDKKVRAVGNPADRFNEDPTRILRGIRFATKYDFEIEANTKKAMIDMRGEICKPFINEAGLEVPRVPEEKIREELIKTIEADPARFLKLWDEVGLLEFLLPEVEHLKGIEQPKIHHSEGDVFVHTAMVLEKMDAAASVEAKLAALLHDIGKPKSAAFNEEKQRITFFGHEEISAEMAAEILSRLRFTVKEREKILWLIRNHSQLYGFSKMRLAKQKKLVRHPFFSDLVDLVKSDALSSVREDGTVETEFLNDIRKVLKMIEAEEKAGRAATIINGDEVVKVFKEEGADKEWFQKGGRLIGQIIEFVNDSYLEHQISTKEEAIEAARKMAKHFLSRG